MSYRKAVRIVDKVLDGLSAENCTFGERYPDAYAYLETFRGDLIEDVKSVLEERNWKAPAATDTGGWQKDDKESWHKLRTSGLYLSVAPAYGGFAWAVRREEGEVPLYKGSTRTLEQAKMLADETAVRRCEGGA